MKIFVAQNLHKLREVLNDILGTGNAGEFLKGDPNADYGLTWSNPQEQCVDHGDIFGFQDATQSPNATVDWAVFTVNPTNTVDFGVIT